MRGKYNVIRKPSYVTDPSNVVATENEFDDTMTGLRAPRIRRIYRDVGINGFLHCAQICCYRKTFPSDSAMYGRAADVYLAALTAIEGTTKWLCFCCLADNLRREASSCVGAWRTLHQVLSRKDAGS